MSDHPNTPASSGQDVTQGEAESLRDRFAVQIASGLACNVMVSRLLCAADREVVGDAIASFSYEIADKLLVVRQRKAAEDE